LTSDHKAPEGALREAFTSLDIDAFPHMVLTDVLGFQCEEKGYGTRAPGAWFVKDREKLEIELEKK